MHIAGGFLEQHEKHKERVARLYPSVTKNELSLQRELAEVKLRLKEAHIKIEQIEREHAKVTGELIEIHPGTAPLEYIIKVVALHYNVRRIDLKSDRRLKAITLPRFVYYYLARRCTKASSTCIGRHCGKRDHSSVLNGVAKMLDMMKTDQQFAGEIQDMENSINKHFTGSETIK